MGRWLLILKVTHCVLKYDPKLLNCKFTYYFIMAFNPEVALFNLLEDAQTSAELLAVIDDYLADNDEV